MTDAVDSTSGVARPGLSGGTGLTSGRKIKTPNQSVSIWTLAVGC